MCLACSDIRPGDYFKAAPNYCSAHPDVNKGNRYLSPIGFYHYQYPCEKCILDCIKNLPEYMAKYNPEVAVDANTIQVVLDALDQRLGIF